MSEKEPFHGTIKDHDLDLLVGFKRSDDRIQLRNGFRPKDVERG